MIARLQGNLDRRQFMKHAGLGAAALCGIGRAGLLRAAADEDPPNTHNMLIVGERTIFLSHLPMFQGVDKSKSSFRSPHRFQVILEATFTVRGKDAGEIYRKDRQAHPATRIYTLEPEDFVLSRLFVPANRPQIASFNAKVFRGHLERGGKPVPGLENVTVNISRVVEAHEFMPQAQKATALEYTLFGKGSEFFLAHSISLPPDFDQVLAVKVAGRQLTDEDLGAAMRVVIPDRKNVAAARLKPKQRAQATLGKSAGASSSNVQLEAGTEFYFEEGELLMPPTFDPTPEEKKK